MAGDKVHSSINPLVSAKLDFADFLTIIVRRFKTLGVKIKRDFYEIITYGKF